MTSGSGGVLCQASNHGMRGAGMCLTVGGSQEDRRGDRLRLIDSS